ncbi:MAG: DUF2971 domain-containing protein [Thermodesulfobacteriota bacterium]
MAKLKYPKKLYKFSGWELDRNKKLLTQHQIFLSSIDNFNDPFENLVPIDYKKFSPNDWIDKIIEVNSRSGIYKNFSEAEKKAHASADYLEQLRKGRFNYDEISRTGYEYRKDNFAVYCLSATKANLLLWSHYSNSHKGICIAYDTEQLLNFLESNYREDANEISLEKVNYYRRFPFYDARNINDPYEYMLKSLVTKSIDWEYEIEYRLISNVGKTNFPVDLQDGIISEVIMGARMKEVHTNEIIQFLQQKKSQIKLYKAEISNRRFALSFERVNY